MPDDKPVDLKQTGTDEKIKTKKKLYFGGVSLKTILFFTKNIGIMIRSGSTLAEALQVLQVQAKGKFKDILMEVSNKIQRGMSFSDALSGAPKVFSEMYINIVRIGEESGTLDKNIEYLTSQLEKSYKLKRKIIGAMIYPAIIVSGIVILGAGIALFVLPKLSQMFKGFKVELPLSTRILIATSDFLQAHGILSILILGALIALFIFLSRLKALKPLIHRSFLFIPVVKQISRSYNLSLFYRNLSILLKSGGTIDEGLKTCAKTINNYRYKDQIILTLAKIKSGQTLNEALKEKNKLFPPTDLQIITVGEESGTLSDALAYAATIHEEELDDVTQNLSTLLEPILFIILGIAVATLALSIISPIYSITQKFD